MKRRNDSIASFLVSCFLLAGIVACSGSKQAGSSAASADIIQAISNDNWVFTANNVLPQGSRSRFVNGVYQAKCSKDTLVVSLPYFGRAFSGGITTDNPMNFRSVDFSLEKSEAKNGAHVVTIKPRDNREIQSLSFNFYDNGSAQLSVLLTNRSPISYTGTVGVK